MDEIEQRNNVEEEIKELNEAIIIAEKKLIKASKNLSTLYGNDKEIASIVLEEETDEEKLQCDKLLINYGEVVDELKLTRIIHESNIKKLKNRIGDITNKHNKLRDEIKNRILTLKLSFLNKREKKNVNHELLLKNYKKQEELEQSLIKLRILNLLRGQNIRTIKNVKSKSNLLIKELALKEKQNELNQQLNQLKDILNYKKIEGQRIRLENEKLRTQRKILDKKITTLISDREMAYLQYKEMSREFDYEQNFHKCLQERLEKAKISKDLNMLIIKHKELIWNIVLLDASAKTSSKQCDTLHKQLIKLSISN